MSFLLRSVKNDMFSINHEFFEKFYETLSQVRDFNTYLW